MQPVSFSSRSHPESPTSPKKRPSLPFVSRVHTPPEDIRPGVDDVSYLSGLARVTGRVWDYLLTRLHIAKTPSPSLKTTLTTEAKSANPHYDPQNHAQHYNMPGRTLPIIMHEHAHGVLGPGLLRYSQQNPRRYAKDLAYSISSNPWQHLILRDPADAIDIELLTERQLGTQPVREAFQYPELQYPVNGLSKTDKKCLRVAAALFARELQAQQQGRRFRTARAIRKAADRLSPEAELTNQNPAVLRPAPSTIHFIRIHHFLKKLREIHSSNTLPSTHHTHAAIVGPLSSQEHRLVRSQARQLALSQLGLLEDTKKDLKDPVKAFFYTLSPNEVQANLREYALSIRLHKQALQRMADSDHPERAAAGKRIIETLQERPLPLRSLEDQPKEWIRSTLKPLEKDVAGLTPHLQGLLEDSVHFNIARQLRRLNAAVVNYTKSPTKPNSRRIKRRVQNTERLLHRAIRQGRGIFQRTKTTLTMVRQTLLQEPPKAKH